MIAMWGFLSKSYREINGTVADKIISCRLNNWSNYIGKLYINI